MVANWPETLGQRIEQSTTGELRIPVRQLREGGVDPDDFRTVVTHMSREFAVEGVQVRIGHTIVPAEVVLSWEPSA